jgi:hypothetical protein
MRANYFPIQRWVPKNSFVMPKKLIAPIDIFYLKIMGKAVWKDNERVKA